MALLMLLAEVSILTMVYKPTCNCGGRHLVLIWTIDHESTLYPCQVVASARCVTFWRLPWFPAREKDTRCRTCCTICGRWSLKGIAYLYWRYRGVLMCLKIRDIPKTSSKTDSVDHSHLETHGHGMLWGSVFRCLRCFRKLPCTSIWYVHIAVYGCIITWIVYTYAIICIYVCA